MPSTWGLTKEQAGYKPAPKPEVRCDACEFMFPRTSTGTCKYVRERARLRIAPRRRVRRRTTRQLGEFLARIDGQAVILTFGDHINPPANSSRNFAGNVSRPLSSSFGV